jgi:hypothetical protein
VNERAFVEINIVHDRWQPIGFENTLNIIQCNLGVIWIVGVKDGLFIVAGIQIGHLVIVMFLQVNSKSIFQIYFSYATV